MDFNGKIDDVYTNMNTKFESFSTHVNKLEMQVIQTGEDVKRQEASIKGEGEEALKHHVSAIIDNDSWQVVKHEKLQEGDFEVESSMSFGSSHLCRSTPREEHRPRESSEHRPTCPV
ncbi:hypothetical protein F2Q70_00025774 [Brassica cretica]|uniref:Uncharacterized protein n=1 Tax=Brassica cretica TaxID=69181 RepID=A0A8S9LC27_BRACR|nr:hypothetical protein F2Q70_00025774 [Brassica cretica]